MREQLIFISIFFSSVSCENILVSETLRADQQAVFEVLWEDFDENYAGFTVRNVDWDSVYVNSMAIIESGIDQGEFKSMMGQILLSFQDIHTSFHPVNSSAIVYEPSNPNSLKSIGSLDHYFDERLSRNQVMKWGTIADHEIGYIHILTFDQNSNLSEFLFIDAVVKQLKDTKALIIDLRQNQGGDPAPTFKLASRFVAHEFVAVKQRFRNGLEQDEFGEPLLGVIKPEGAFQYLKPIAILMNKSSLSSAEIFVMILATQNHVTTIGDYTAGGLGFSDYRELQNGWGYRLTTTLASNVNDEIFEGTGIPPQELVHITSDDSIHRSDPQLERAVALLK